MEQFIGCDAHKNFSVFVAVNEKGHAGEALRVAHDRQLYREFLARLPAHSAIAVEASGSYSWLVDEMERAGPQAQAVQSIGRKTEDGADPQDRQTGRSCFGTAHCRKSGFHQANCAISASCCGSGSFW